MLFAEYMSQIAARMQEPDSATTNVRVTAGIPYYIKDELEHVVVMSLNQVVREVDPIDWDSFSSDAVTLISGGAPAGGIAAGWSTLAVPANFLKILTASIDNEACVVGNVDSMFQLTGSRYTSVVGLYGGAVYFRGTSITLTVLIEPSMGTWRTAQSPILPPGYDARALDIMAKRILISDYVPEWRA